MVRGAPRKRYRLGGNRAGAAYLIAVVSLLVGLTFALAMIRATSAYFTAENSRHKKQQVASLAEAGVDYVYWQVHYKNQPLPYTTDLSLGGATIHIEAADDGARGDGVQWRSTMVVTSTATIGKHKAVAKRVVLGLMPYEYRFFSDKDPNDGDAITGTGSGLGFRSNSNIALNSISNNISSGIWAAGTIVAKGNANPKYPSSPPVALSDIDYAYYNSIAGSTYSTDLTLGNFSGPYTGIVATVNGKVSLGGYYRGMCTIVATGDITIRSDVWAADSNSYLALITKGKIIIQGTSTYVQAVMYAHKSDDTAEIHFMGWPRSVGAAVSDKISTDNSTTFDWDSRLNLQIMRGLKMPGL